MLCGEGKNKESSLFNVVDVCWCSLCEHSLLVSVCVLCCQPQTEGTHTHRSDWTPHLVDGLCLLYLSADYKVRSFLNWEATC